MIQNYARIYARMDRATKSFVEDLRRYLLSCNAIVEVGEVYESGNAGPGEPAWTVEATDDQGRVFNVEVFGPYVEGGDSA